MMNPPKRERPVERVARAILSSRDLVIATTFLILGYVMGMIPH